MEQRGIRFLKFLEEIMNKLLMTTILLIFVFSFQQIDARSFRVGQIPNGSVNNCLTCHTVAFPVSGNGPRNDFGKLVEGQFLTVQGSTGNVIWNALLASLDADNDGVSNGEELQNRFGSWIVGNPQPGNPVLVSLPGNATSSPAFTLTLQFSGMTPHVGQQLGIRVVDKSTGKESGREVISAVPGASFNVDLPVILTGHSYWIDFYADHNNNGLYNPPPADHAWRLELDNVSGNSSVPFSHNTNFTDIDWVYNLTVQFTGMTPHVGQLLELRVVEASSGNEAGRSRLEAVGQADFNVDIPGIRLGTDYQLDFYADLNQNHFYNAPPTDHAWRLTFNSTTGDQVLDFSHNANFTDVAWNYLFTMNLSSMTPHLGQLFEFRVVNEANSEEVGRVRLDSILVPDFVVAIPGILTGNNYRADFYADHNGNGTYDPPPADHAWRVLFSVPAGNVVENFTHNTNFTNINWPTGIALDPLTGLPGSFMLEQNYPNPFNPETRIRFTIPEAAEVSLEVFDLLGRKLNVLLNRNMIAGSYEVIWDGRDQQGRSMSSGVYVYRLTAGIYQDVKRMVLMK